MIDFFDKLYSSIINKNVFLIKIRFYSFLRVIVRITANILLSAYFKLSSNNPDYTVKPTEKTTGRFIVSLTSFPIRINKVWLVIETILRQTQKPDMIILWLSENQFKTKDVLPKNLLELQKRGLKIELRSEDIRSHKKYYYVLKEYLDDILITIDDDIFYRTDMIKKLLLQSANNPNTIIANYVQVIAFDNENTIMPYNQWKYIDKENTKPIFFGSGGGTLFPIGSLPKEVLNKHLFMKICPTADDIWLNAMAHLQKTKIIYTATTFIPVPIINKTKITLSSGNVRLGQNDIQIKAVRKYYINKLGIDPYAK